MKPRVSVKRVQWALDEFYNWYEKAYLRMNVRPSIVQRNISIMKDAFDGNGGEMLPEFINGIELPVGFTDDLS